MKKIVMITLAMLGALATQNIRSENEQYQSGYPSIYPSVKVLKDDHFKTIIKELRDSSLTEFLKLYLAGMKMFFCGYEEGSFYSRFDKVKMAKWSKKMSSLPEEDKKLLLQTGFMQAMSKGAQRLGSIALGSGLLGLGGILGTAYLARQDYREEKKNEPRWKRVGKYALALSAGILGSVSTIVAISHYNFCKGYLKPLR